MKTRLRYGLAALACYLLFLALNLPAYWLARALAHWSGQQVQLLAVQGTVWRGQCQALQIGAQRFDDVHWDWRLWSLLLARVEVSVTGQAGQRATVYWQGGQKVRLRAADLHLPVSLLASVWAPIAEYGLDGQLGLRSDDLLWDGQLHGQARLSWWQAASNRLPQRPLGDYQAELQTDAHGVNFKLHTVQGILRVQGHGHWRPGERLHFSGSALPQNASQLGELGALLGHQPDAQGVYWLAF